MSRLLGHHDRYLQTTKCLGEADKVRVRQEVVRRGLTNMNEASLVRKKAGNQNLSGVRLTLSRDGQIRVDLAWEALKMECKGSICKVGGVLVVSREADRVVIKEVNMEVTVEDISEDRKAMVIADITRVMEWEVTTATINNSI